MNVLALLLALAAPALAQNIARPETPAVDGIVVGAHVAVAVRALGMPSDVASLDTGHTWTWRTGHAELQAITDDGAVVRAVEDRALDDSEALTVSVDGKPVHIPLRGYTIARADADLNSVAGLSSRTSRLFGLERGRALLLLFDDAGTLTRAVYGDRGFITRLGLITADAEAIKSLRYAAPKVRTTPASLANPSHVTIVRYQLDRDGHVDSVAVEISSHDSSVDEDALKQARRCTWLPAKLNNLPVKSVAFRMIAT